MLQKSQGTPYLIVQQPVKLAFSKAQCSHLGTLWDEGRRKDESRKERDYKDGDVGSGCPHIKGVKDSCAVISGQLLSVEQHPPHLWIYSLNLSKGTGYLSTRTFPWVPLHLQTPSLQAASSEECIKCFHATQFSSRLNISVGFMPLHKSEFYLQAHNLAGSPPEAKPFSQTASGTSVGICRSSEWGFSSAQSSWWKVRAWKMRSFLFYSLGHKELFI